MTTGTTVGTSTSASPLQFAVQTKGPYYVASRYWAFWNDGTNFVYSSSTSLTSGWAAKATAIAGIAPESVSIVLDGNYIHIAYVDSAGNYVLKYIQCVPDSTGALTPSVTRSVTADYGAGGASPRCSICVSSTGYVYISYVDGSNHVLVTKNANTEDNSVWSTDTGFPVTLITDGSYTTTPSIVANGNGTVAALYFKAGATAKFRIVKADATLLAQETATLSNCGGGGNSIISMTVDRSIDKTYIAYLDSSNHLKTGTRTSTGTWDASEVDHATQSGAFPALQFDSATNKVYFIYIDGSNLVKYDVWIGSAWVGVTTLFDESADGGLTQAQLSSPNYVQNTKLIVAYKTKTSSAYNIKVSYLDLVIAPVAAFSADVTTGTIGTKVTFTDASTGPPASWSWDFGDGVTSTSQNPTHVYVMPGTLHRDADGDERSRLRWRDEGGLHRHKWHSEHAHNRL